MILNALIQIKTEFQIVKYNIFDLENTDRRANIMLPISEMCIFVIENVVFGDWKGSFV